MMSREAHTRGPRYDGDSHGKHDGSTINVIVARFMVKVVGSAAFLPGLLRRDVSSGRTRVDKHCPAPSRKYCTAPGASDTRYNTVPEEFSLQYGDTVARWMW